MKTPDMTYQEIADHFIASMEAVVTDPAKQPLLSTVTYALGGITHTGVIAYAILRRHGNPRLWDRLAGFPTHGDWSFVREFAHPDDVVKAAARLYRKTLVSA